MKKLMFCAMILTFGAGALRAEDAYIQSDGANTINTGYHASGKTKIAVDFQLTTIEANHDTLFGHYGNTFSLLCYCVGGAPFRAEAKDGAHQSWPLQPEVTVDTARHTIVVDAPNRHMTLSAADGTLQAERDFNAAWTLNSKSNWPLLLFGSSKNEIGEPRQPVYAKIYGAKIWETEGGVETLIHDYVPATKGGAVGFYDKETGDFLPEQQYVGSKFTAGGDGVVALDDDPYVESDGTGAINTGIVAQPKMKIALDYALMDATDPLEEGAEGNHYQQRLFGQDTVDSLPRISVYINNSRNLTLASGDGWNAWSSGLTADNRERHTLFFDNVSGTRGIITGITTNKVQTGQADLTKRANRPLALFGDSSNDAATQFKLFSKAKVYGLRIWVDGVLVRDFAPRRINGVAGFEDLAMGGFYTASGLTAGGNVSAVLSGPSKEGDGYIQSDGSVYSAVDTRYFINSKTKVVLDYQLTGFVSSGIVLGGYGAAAGVSTILWCRNGSVLTMEMHDGNHQGTADNMLGATPPDLLRHTAIFDGPNRHLSLLSHTGEIEAEADFLEAWTLAGTANWPMVLFGSATAAYGSHGQRVKARIFSVKVYEDGQLVHNYLPCVREGVPGFKDDETGLFFSGSGLTAGGNVPEEAETDPYIETGTSGKAIYFDTGYYVSSNTCIVCDYMPLKQQAVQQFPFEAGNSSKVDDYSFMRIYGSGSTGEGNYAYACGKDRYISMGVPYSPNVRHTVTLDALNRKAKIATNGETIREMDIAETARVPLKSQSTLKILSDASGSGHYCTARLFGFQIYEDGALVRDYKPYVKDGLVGLMETANNGGFLPIANTANASLLSYGGNIDIEGRMDAYIENDGATILDLGYRASMKTRVEYDFQNLLLGADKVFFGAWKDDSGYLRYCCWNSSGKIKFIFAGKGAGTQNTTTISTDYGRHTAIMDMKNRALAFVTDGVTNNVTVAGTFNDSDVSSQNMGAFAALTGGMVSRSRIYAVRIYETENGVENLVHEFLPYKNGETNSLYDTKSGAVATKATASMAWPKISGKGVDGAERWIVAPQGARLSKRTGTATLSANAAGAVSYRWTRNGEPVAGGEDGDLTVEWEKAKTGTTETYAVVPLYDICGNTSEGAPVTVTVEHLSAGTLLLFR